MPGQAQPDLVTVSVKFLAFLALIVTDTKALPISQSIGARGMGITSPNENLMTVKNILEWLFAAAAVIVICSVIIWRVRFLRARDRPLRDFFTFIEAPQRRGDSSRSIRLNPQARDGGLTPISFNLQRIGRTRATDVDSEGRRAGGPDPDDTNSDITEKDALPAYEFKGGPPDYGQFLAVDLGTGTNARLQITETVPVGPPYPQSQLVGTSSGTMNPSTQLNPALGVQLPHPPPPSYTPAKATTHPITPP